jgi:RNA recognition motif-containing protein
MEVIKNPQKLKFQISVTQLHLTTSKFFFYFFNYFPQDLFGKFGKVDKAFVKKKGEKSLGIGFVFMKSPEDAEKAVKEYDGAELDDKPIVVRLSEPPKGRLSIQKKSEPKKPEPKERKKSEPKPKRTFKKIE